MWWRITLWAAIVLVALVFLYLVRSILLPFIVALLVSALLEPTVRRLRRRGMGRGAAVGLVFFLFFGVITAIGVVVAPMIGRQLGSFRDNLQAFSRTLAEERPADSAFQRWNPKVRWEAGGPSEVDRILVRYGSLFERLGMPTTRRGLVEQYVDPHRRDIARYVQQFFNSFLGIVTSFAGQVLFLLLTPLLVWMILMDLEELRIRGMTWIPPAVRRGTVDLMRDVGNVFVNYLRGVAINLSIYAVLAAIVLFVLGAPYAILLALLYAAIYLIPIIGTFITYASLFILTGLTSDGSTWFFNPGSPWVVAGVITAIFAILTEVYDKTVMPRILGSKVGLHPVAGIFVALAGGALFGLVGMIVAYPLGGAIKAILARILRVTSSTGTEDLGLPATPLRHRTVAEV